MARCDSSFNLDGQWIPCGKCLNCKANRVSGWSFRLHKEWERSSSAHFVTLTYDEATVPYYGEYQSLHKIDVQNFLKRLRKLNPQKLKYYAASEYGPDTYRPHYHIVLFNAIPETIEKAWTQGFSTTTKVTSARIGYTLGYLAKPRIIPAFPQDPRQREFSLMSKRLGDNYLTVAMQRWHSLDYKNRLYCNIKDGKKIAMPRYYREKIFSKEQIAEIVIHLEEQELAEERAHPVENIVEHINQKKRISLNNYRKLHAKSKKTGTL